MIFQTAFKTSHFYKGNKRINKKVVWMRGITFCSELIHGVCYPNSEWNKAGQHRAVLQLGQYIMIVTNPWWQMTVLLAVWINRWRSSFVHVCVALVCSPVWKNQFSPSFYFLYLSPSLLIYGYSPTSWDNEFLVWCLLRSCESWEANKPVHSQW